MPAAKITEQQFRVRRRDRRMVWVDALAFALGLLIVAASVGGVLFLEKEREPIEWRFSFPDARMPERGVCVGFIAEDAARMGCADREHPPISEQPAMEGVPIEYAGPKWNLNTANVTMVTFELSWIDEIPLTEAGCKEYCDRNFVYDENATDILRLEVFTPWGERFVDTKANSADPDRPLAGLIRISIPILSPEGGNITALTQKEAADRLNETHYVDDHPGIGQWRTIVTVVRAGDIEGTVPINACTAAGINEEMQNQTGLNENCYLYDTWDANSDLWYELYGEQLEPVQGDLPYSSSYVDESTAWTLKMIVRTYEARISF